MKTTAAQCNDSLQCWWWVNDAHLCMIMLKFCTCRFPEKWYNAIFLGSKFFVLECSLKCWFVKTTSAFWETRIYLWKRQVNPEILRKQMTFSAWNSSKNVFPPSLKILWANFSHTYLKLITPEKKRNSKSITTPMHAHGERENVHKYFIKHIYHVMTCPTRI